MSSAMIRGHGKGVFKYIKAVTTHMGGETLSEWNQRTLLVFGFSLL